MAGKPKDDISSSKDDYWRTKEERDEFDKAIKDLKAQLASKEKELLMKTNECQISSKRISEVVNGVLERLRPYDDGNGNPLYCVNQIVAYVEKQEKRIKELEATTGCRMYFKNKCNAGEAYGAESKKLKKENVALTAKLKERDGWLREGRITECKFEKIGNCDLVAALKKERDELKEIVRLLVWCEDCAAYREGENEDYNKYDENYDKMIKLARKVLEAIERQAGCDEPPHYKPFVIQHFKKDGPDEKMEEDCHEKSI